MNVKITQAEYDRLKLVPGAVEINLRPEQFDGEDKCLVLYGHMFFV